jgi:hypothetical protein
MSLATLAARGARWWPCVTVRVVPRKSLDHPRQVVQGIVSHMKVQEIAEAVAKLPPDQLARFRRWFTAFEAGRINHAEELDSTASKLGRLAGRAFAKLKKRTKEP